VTFWKDTRLNGKYFILITNLGAEPVLFIVGSVDTVTLVYEVNIWQGESPGAVVVIKCSTRQQ